MASVLEKTIRGAVTAGVGKISELSRKRLPGDTAFMRGIHTPMAEELTIEDLRVSGYMKPISTLMKPLRVAGGDDEAPLVHHVDRERQYLHRPAHYLTSKGVIELHCLSIPFVDRAPGWPGSGGQTR